MNSLTLTFKDVNLTPTLHNNQIYFTATELASLLGYANARSVTNLYNNHSDEFDEEMSLVTKLVIKGFGNGNSEKDVRIFSLLGSHLIAMFANTPVAKECRQWILKLIKKETSQNQTALPAPTQTTLTPEEQNMVQNAVKATHDRTGLSYGEIWARTKNKFKVAKYDQIERTQLRDALIYIASMSAIRAAGRNEIIISLDLFDAIMKHTRLAVKLAEQTEIFHRQLYLMLGLDRTIRNEIGALSHDVAHEFNLFLRKGEEILAQHQPVFELPSY